MSEDKRKRVFNKSLPKPRGNYVLIKQVDYLQKEGEVKTTVTLEDKGECTLEDINNSDEIIIIEYGQDILVGYEEEKEGKTVKNKIFYTMINSNQIVGKY